MSVQKRVAAVHDLSCVGKCSLTAALPVLSAAGIEACPVPTAVLSTHTGDIAGFTSRHDGADSAIINHWLSLDLTFDAIAVTSAPSASWILSASDESSARRKTSSL